MNATSAMGFMDNNMTLDDFRQSLAANGRLRDFHSPIVPT
jgi:hypothetical protein